MSAWYLKNHNHSQYFKSAGEIFEYASEVGLVWETVNRNTVLSLLQGYGVLRNPDCWSLLSWILSLLPAQLMPRKQDKVVEQFTDEILPCKQEMSRKKETLEDFLNK